MITDLVDRAKWLWRDRPEEVLIGGFIAALVIALAVIIPIAMQDQSAWEQHCVRDLGGRVVSHTSIGTGTSTKGGSVSTTTSTTYYCLSPSGGILDIR